jgi:hypothetical protein
MQNYVCAVCLKFELSEQHGTLAVDHNHITGKNRGLLCGNCNKALGLLREDPSIIKSLLKYLDKYA